MPTSFWDKLNPQEMVGNGAIAGKFWDQLGTGNMVGGGAKTGQFWNQIKTPTTAAATKATPVSPFVNTPQTKDWRVPMSSAANVPFTKSSPVKDAAASAKETADYLNSPAGILVETIKGLPAALKQILLEEPARRGAGIALEGTGGEYTPENAVSKFVLGEKPVKPLSQQGKETLQGLGVPEKQAGKFGLATGLVFMGLDVSGLGGKGGVVKSLVNATDVKSVSGILKNIGVADDVIKTYAPVIAKSKSEAEVIRMIDSIENLQKTTKMAELTGSKLPEQGSLTTSQLSKSLPLETKAASTPLMSSRAMESGKILLNSPEIDSLPKLSTPIGESQDAVKLVTDALTGAKPIRGQQEAIYSLERSKLAGKITGIGKNIPGEQGYYAQLGALKGELSKVEFEGIREKLTQPVIDDLFSKVEKSESLMPFQKITAKTGLTKLLGAKGGIVPTKNEISLLEQVFGKEFTEAVLDKQTTMTKLWGAGANLLNLPRAIQSTADLSAPLRQGVFLIGRPKEFIPAFGSMFKYAFSESAYHNLMEQIVKRSTYPLMEESKLSLTGIGANPLVREEAFMSDLAERIPVFGRIARGSNRAYSGFLNKLRADVFDSVVKNAEKTGVSVDAKSAKDISRFINAATGRGDLPEFLKGSAPILNGLFYSPRLMASRMNLLNPQFYVSLSPTARKEALKSLVSFTVIMSAVLSLASLNKNVSISTDARNADFLKIKIGDTRYDIMGGFQQFLVAGYRLLTNQMVSSTTGKEFTLGEGYKPTTRMDIIQKFFENKTSPIASFVIGLLKGQNAIGDKFNTSAETANRFIPMIVQDIYDLYLEDGVNGVMESFPGVFGVGLQTYTDKIPLKSKTAAGKPTIEWRSQETLGEAIVNKITGTKIEPVPVKKVYDQVQELLNQGHEDDAQIIVNNLSEEDYEIYKKFKQRDARMASDQIMARLTPIYKNNKALIAQGRGAEAQKIVDLMTDEEYAIYEKIKNQDYAKIQ